jgi:hypothetical protein
MTADPTRVGAEDALGSKELSHPTTALDLVGEEAKPINPEVERRVVRKIDTFLMPAMVIGEL